MKRIVCCLLCALLLAAIARAEDVRYFKVSGESEGSRTYAYGGSGRDWLYDIAVSEDDRIALTGWTESSDGTLSQRTRTGRSGWLLVIDAQGNELINFCTRLGTHDNLTAPVFHADGTLTTMLFAEDPEAGWVKLEWIRFDRKGKIISRKVLMESKTPDDPFVSIVGRDARGYLLCERMIRGKDGYTHYELYDGDGNPIRRLEEWSGVHAIAQHHVIRLDNETEEEMALYARDVKGKETRLARVFALREDDLVPVRYNGFLSLDAGGAAGTGWALEEKNGEKERIGRFTRWDAQGHVVAEMNTPSVGYCALTQRPGGFAAIANPVDGHGFFDDSQVLLHLLDENGVLERSIAIADDAVNTGHSACVAALADGTLVIVHIGEQNADDAIVTMVDGKIS